MRPRPRWQNANSLYRPSTNSLPGCAFVMLITSRGPLGFFLVNLRTERQRFESSLVRSFGPFFPLNTLVWHGSRLLLFSSGVWCSCLYSARLARLLLGTFQFRGLVAPCLCSARLAQSPLSTFRNLVPCLVRLPLP